MSRQKRSPHNAKKSRKRARRPPIRLPTRATPLEPKESTPAAHSDPAKTFLNQTHQPSPLPENGEPTVIRPEQGPFPGPRGFPIVGIGASAGGLEAFTQFLSSLSTDTGMAFVLIQHLDPKHESMSTEILSRVTEMPVNEVQDGMRVEPNHVYVIPPNFSMGILHGVLKLLPRTDVRGQHMVIDFFFQSLAEDQKNLAVGIVLSGTGSDGTQGLMTIKSEGGITFAQAPDSAKFESMPQSAIASGAVDLVLSPEKIALELARIAQYPFIHPMAPEKAQTDDEKSVRPQDSLSQIFVLLRNLCHVDFTYYKANTIQRRINRRIVLHRMENIAAYVRFLTQNPNEVKALFSDILIHVTGFFRDPDAFRALNSEVFPKILEQHASGVPIRIWVPGCSTGEEVYSIAISLTEFLGEKGSHIPIQIFASDISEQALQKARVAEYSESISREVSPERLSRFFVRMEEGGYKISKAIRDLCLFSRHDLTTDPPFAKIDLISCRNLLIYFTASLQSHVIPIFHYALSSRGFLWLGRSETIGGFSGLFTLVDKTNKIYARKNAPVALNLNFPASSYVPGKQGAAQASRSGFAKRPVDVQKMAELALQAKYPGVLINEDLEVLQIRGRVVPFLEPAPGIASHHLLKMAQAGLVPELRTAIQAARKQNMPVKKEGLKFKKGRRLKVLNLDVIPVKSSHAPKERFYLILFEEVTGGIGTKKSQGGTHRHKWPERKRKDPYVTELQRELIAAQEHQAELIEKYEVTQQDLTTANEELQSANEELQSTNEELETAKEELQSGNEELTTVNDELQTRSLEQTQTNNDLVNLLGSVEIPIVMLSQDHRIRRFTPLAGKALNLISSDIGRPIGDLKLNFTAPGAALDLNQVVQEVMEMMSSREIEVQDLNGHWYRLQARPYRTIDHRIDGVVLALVDIHSLKQARTEADRANRSKDLFLATLSHELRTPLTSILSWSEMLRSGKLDSEKQMRGAEIIQESAKTQAQLINDLLDVSRVVSGKLSLDLAEIDPVEVVCAAIESVRSVAEKKAIQIKTDFKPQVGRVLADPTRLKQVFWNLLTNAIKFSPPESQVLVKLEKVPEPSGEKAKAQIQVIDSGKGISPEFLPQIFDRFSQEDSSSVRVHGGLGLGLAIVKNLVELHGGAIHAESPGEGKGATFTMLLPISSNMKSIGNKHGHRGALRGAAAKDDAAQIELGGVRVLIVDDEANAREVFAEILGSFGAEVRAAGSPGEALKLIPEFKPHVLVSDIAMPGEDGYSLMRKVRALPATQGGNIPSLALTAFAGTEDVRHALSAGYQAHLAKPVDGHHLAEVIAKLAGRKSGE